MSKVICKYGGKAFQYGATQGVIELRKALAERYDVPIDNIQITSSSQQGIDAYQSHHSKLMISSSTELLDSFDLLKM